METNIKIFNATETTSQGVLEAIVKKAKQFGLINNMKAVLKEFLNREKMGTTGFENGLAIPHARTKSILKPTIMIARLKNGVDWKSLDGKPSTVAIAIMVSAGKKAGDQHVQMLANVASLLMHKENVAVFKTGNANDIKNY